MLFTLLMLLCIVHFYENIALLGQIFLDIQYRSEAYKLLSLLSHNFQFYFWIALKI